jgi:hypothetical protein
LRAGNIFSFQGYYLFVMTHEAIQIISLYV